MNLPATTPPRKPARVLLIPPSAFQDTYDDRPTDPIAVGLRLLSEHHVVGARAEASKEAVAQFADDEGELADLGAFHDAYNDALLQHLVAGAICDPNSVTDPHPRFRFAADRVSMAFTSEGLRYVYDQLARLHHEASPLVPVISPEGIAELALLLQDGAHARQPRAEQLATGKLLQHCLEQLRGDVAVLPVTPSATVAR